MMENGKMIKRLEKVNHIYNIIFTIGVFYFANNDTYDGEWKDDKKNGKGKPQMYI